MRFARTLPVIALSVAALAGCGREHDDQRALPAATAWKPPPPRPSQVEGGAGAGRVDDPHAGLDSGGDPHAGLDVGQSGGSHASPTGDQDPHAGLDMDGEGARTDGGDPAMAGMSAPDPDRPIDASKFLRGTIRAGSQVGDAVKLGAVLFLSAWPIDPNTGDVLGSPVAVAKVVVEKLPMPFELTERDVMTAGTRFDGEVLIRARVDGDGEARTKLPGDVEGSLRARVPSQDLDLVLDTPLR